MHVGDDGAMIVADVRGEQQPPQVGSVTHVIKVRVADVEAQFERARSHGARVVQEPIEYELASVSARSRISPVTAGSSRRRCETLHPRSGADNRSSASPRHSASLDPTATTRQRRSGPRTQRIGSGRLGQGGSRTAIGGSSAVPERTHQSERRPRPQGDRAQSRHGIIDVRPRQQAELMWPVRGERPRAPSPWFGSCGSVSSAPRAEWGCRRGLRAGRTGRWGTRRGRLRQQCSRLEAGSPWRRGRGPGN
jgi:hypothetical protein